MRWWQYQYSQSRAINASSSSASCNSQGKEVVALTFVKKQMSQVQQLRDRFCSDSSQNVVIKCYRQHWTINKVRGALGTWSRLMNFLKLFFCQVCTLINIFVLICEQRRKDRQTRHWMYVIGIIYATNEHYSYNSLNYYYTLR